ncbi:MAG: metallophosphoesterase [Planctomycetota bacterium]
MADLLFNVAMLAVDALALGLVRRRPRAAGVAGGALLAAGACFGLAVAFAAALGWHPIFATMRFCAWGTFLHGTLLAAGGAWLLRERRSWRIALASLALALVAVAADAFLIEPTALELTRHELRSAKVTRRLRIGVVADLQTDAVGGYERRAIELLLAQEPDLILLPGDYVHVLDPDERERQWAAVNALFRELDLHAPLGVYAVQGDVDPRGWERVFDGLDAELFRATRAVDLDELRITGLSYDDGSTTSVRVPAAEDGRFHIVVAHRPGFAFGDVEADLLVAGHTHGGQVRLPLLGPPITMSRVPRAWAAGRTELAGGRTLIVSRGVGMERGHAPRLRFLCRPEVVVIDVLPAAASAD